MAERESVRIPLQSGATTWRARVAIAVRLVPGVLLLSWLVWLNTRVLQNVTSGLGSSTPGWFAILLLLIGGGFGLVLVLSSLAMRELAREAAPSDVLVDASGFRIVGGMHDGLAASWHDVLELKLIVRPRPQVDGGWRFVREVYFGHKRPETQVAELRVVLLGSSGNTIGVALDAREQRALRSIAELMANAMREARGSSLAPGAISSNLEPAVREQPALAPVALVCSACQSAVAPDAAAEVVCPKCRARIPVPTTIRDKVKEVYALPALRAKGQAALRRMLRAPAASSMALVISVLGVAILALWPAALMFVWMTARGALMTVDLLGLGAVMVATIAAILLVDALLHPLILARYAHPVTIIDYAARPPLYEGGPMRCRTCEAALPARFDGRLARCIACASDNVLAMDLSHELPMLRRQASVLDADLEQWRRSRVRTGMFAAVAAVALAGLGGFASYRLRHDTYDARLKAACERGERFQCTMLAIKLRNDHRPDLAASVLERACDPRSSDSGAVDACKDLAFMLSDVLHRDDPRWPARDLSRAESLLASACAHGSKLACTSHQALCERRNAPASCHPQ